MTAPGATRAKKLCTAGECPKPNYSNGLCTTHYQRRRRLGRLDLAPQPTVAERLLAGSVVDENGCRVWAGAPGLNGYGRMSVGNASDYVHRLAYVTWVGPIPEGLTIDHLCRVRLCLEPSHLEPVTRAENTRRELVVRYAS